MLQIRIASALTLAAVAAWIGLGWTYPVLNLSENQALYTFSSETQVIAAIYGLTITGYIFLRNQQDRLVDRDETLAEILDSIQLDQYRAIAFITIISLTAIAFGMLAIIFREFTSPAIKVFTQNTAASLFIASLAWTGVFVLDTMRPGKISRASQAIKVEAEHSATAPSQTPGKLEDFLVSFNSIEQLLDEFARQHLDRQTTITYSLEVETNRRRAGRPAWTKPRIVRALVSQEIIFNQLAEELISLIRYRNALVHGQDMTVSADMIDRVRAAKSELELRIGNYTNQS